MFIGVRVWACHSNIRWVRTVEKGGSSVQSAATALSHISPFCYGITVILLHICDMSRVFAVKVFHYMS